MFKCLRLSSGRRRNPYWDSQYLSVPGLLFPSLQTLDFTLSEGNITRFYDFFRVKFLQDVCCASIIVSHEFGCHRPRGVSGTVYLYNRRCTCSLSTVVRVLTPNWYDIK